MRNCLLEPEAKSQILALPLVNSELYSCRHVPDTLWEIRMVMVASSLDMIGLLWKQRESAYEVPRMVPATEGLWIVA